jgi:hypothetical protein
MTLLGVLAFAGWKSYYPKPPRRGGKGQSLLDPRDLPPVPADVGGDELFFDTVPEFNA